MIPIICIVLNPYFKIIVPLNKTTHPNPMDPHFLISEYSTFFLTAISSTYTSYTFPIVCTIIP